MIGARWNSVRMEKKFTDALSAVADLGTRYERAAAEVARETSQRIAASGRGGAHNPEFADIQYRVWKSGSGRWNINLGWLNPGAGARERGSGGRLWYQYQDSGFHLFGGSRWIDGVGATIDQRYRLLEALEEVNIEMVGELKRRLGR